MRKIATFMGAALAATALAQQPTAPASIVREGVTEQLTNHVWAIPDGGASLVPNVGIVVGTKAGLAIGTGMGTRNGDTVLRETLKVAGGKPSYPVTTHVHHEHARGAHVFPTTSTAI